MTWESEGQDGSFDGVYGQLFDGNSKKIGNEFRANTYTTNWQGNPSVASFSNGNFIVSWTSPDQDGSDDGVYGQLFDGNTSKIGSEFQVNSYTTNHQSYPSVASFSNGNFVVTWASNGQDGSNYGVYGQLFDGNGSMIGSEFRANSYTNSFQGFPSVASFSNGNFVVTWHSVNQDSSDQGIYGQLFGKNGTKIGSEFQANSYTNNSQGFPSVESFNDDNFVVTWYGEGQDGSGNGIYGQLFDGNGTKIGSEFRANSYTTSNQRDPSVATFSNGNFVVTWQSSIQDGSGDGVYGQLFDETGKKIGSEFRANSYTTNDQRNPSVATFSNGNFIVTWASFGQDGWIGGIFGQIFHDNITYPSISISISSYTTNTTKITSSIRSSTTTSRASSSTTLPSITRSKTLSNDRATFSATSNPNNPLLWLWLLLGIGGGTTCLGLTGYFLLKKRRKERENHTSSFPLATFPPMDPERSLSDRAEKGHTRIGGKYDLINKISRDEAQMLLEQTGISVEFTDSQYRTKVLLGEGNFGKLRIARDLHGHYLGVKKVKGEEEIAQSRSEGSLQAKLIGKPNIMPILDFVESKSSQNQPVLYQFMPLAGFGNGETLRDHLQTLSDPARREQILTHVAKGLLTGLSHMHEAHIYHLDMKPSNMVLDMKGELFIIDFGCAKELPSSQIREEMTGDTEYYPPERIAFYRQMCNRQQPDPIAADKIDAWALGVSLLELATGAYPFDRTGFFAKIKHWDNAYFQAKLDEIPLLKNPAPGSFMSIVKGLLVVDPQKRLSIEDALAQFAHIAPFPSPSEQQAAFANLNQQTPSSTEPPVPSLPRDQDERYAAVFTRRYGLTPDSVHPEYELTPSFVRHPSSSQASSAGQYRSYEEVMRAE